MEIYGYVYTEPLQREGANRFLACLGMICYKKKKKGGRINLSSTNVCFSEDHRRAECPVGWELVEVVWSVSEGMRARD